MHNNSHCKQTLTDHEGIRYSLDTTDIQTQTKHHSFSQLRTQNIITPVTTDFWNVH